ncbi:unnamed protein product [Trichobilharzia regenti]|nr:unnamed protein product [Trichobilharzia regenti]
MCKNLCISVDKTHRQSVSSPHSTISSTLSPNNNNNHINATANYGSHSPFSPLGDAESVHSIETDSWVWPTTPSMKSDKNSSSQLLSNTLDNEIIEKDNSQKNNSCKYNYMVHTHTRTNTHTHIDEFDMGNWVFTN